MEKKKKIGRRSHLVFVQFVYYYGMDACYASLFYPTWKIEYKYVDSLGFRVIQSLIKWYDAWIFHCLSFLLKTCIHITCPYWCIPFMKASFGIEWYDAWIFHCLSFLHKTCIHITSPYWCIRFMKAIFGLWWGWLIWMWSAYSHMLAINKDSADLYHIVQFFLRIIRHLYNKQ